MLGTRPRAVLYPIAIAPQRAKPKLERSNRTNTAHSLNRAFTSLTVRCHATPLQLLTSTLRPPPPTHRHSVRALITTPRWCRADEADASTVSLHLIDRCHKRTRCPARCSHVGSDTQHQAEHFTLAFPTRPFAFLLNQAQPHSNLALHSPTALSACRHHRSLPHCSSSSLHLTARLQHHTSCLSIRAALSLALLRSSHPALPLSAAGPISV